MILGFFMSQKNHQLLRFYSKGRCLETKGIGVIHLQSPRGLLYTFLPIHLMSSVVVKLKQERVKMLLIVPHWSRLSWLPNLVASCFSVLPAELARCPQPAMLKLTAWWLSSCVCPA